MIMKWIGIIVLSSISQTIFGQILVNGVDINRLENVTYIQIETAYIVAKSKPRVLVDYGQSLAGLSFKERSVDEGENKKEFNSSVDALNFFLNNGWDFVQIFITRGQADASTNVTTYLLKRKKV